MKLLFVRSDKILSKLICWILDEPASHLAIEWGRIVIHSTHKGVHLVWKENFYKSYKIVDAFNFVEQPFFANVLIQEEGDPYDYKGFAYFAYRALLKKLFKIGFPRRNAWAENDKFLCVELAKIPDLSSKDLAILTPWAIRNLLKQST